MYILSIGARTPPPPPTVGKLFSYMGNILQLFLTVGGPFLHVGSLFCPHGQVMGGLFELPHSHHSPPLTNIIILYIKSTC